MNRRYDLDSLRVIAFGMLILFHSGMLFSTWGWHVKNLETSEGLTFCMRFLHDWRMPLLFFISGSAVWFAMDHYSVGQYFLERQKRLLLPLVFGMLVVIPPQIYCERLYHMQQFESFWHFYSTVFTSGPYPQGNLSWHHLWYVPYIWVYSMLMLPVFVWLKSRSGRQMVLDPSLSRIAKPWMLFLLFVPSAISDMVLRPFWPGDNCSLLSDWGNFTHKLTFFTMGFCLASATQVYDLIAKHRRNFLLAGVFAFGVLQLVWFLNADFHGIWRAGYLLFYNFHIWMWILAVLGYGRRYLSFNHPFLRKANEAVYPFYILHQTVIVAVGYQLVYVNWSIPVKFVVVVAAMFLITYCIYAFAIRPWNIMRVCFGMKWRKRSPDAEQAARIHSETKRLDISMRND